MLKVFAFKWELKSHEVWVEEYALEAINLKAYQLAGFFYGFIFSLFALLQAHQCFDLALVS